MSNGLARNRDWPLSLTPAALSHGISTWHVDAAAMPPILHLSQRNLSHQILQPLLFQTHPRASFMGSQHNMSCNTQIQTCAQVNLWPAHESERTGFGWFQPRATWTLPPQLRTWRAW